MGILYTYLNVSDAGRTVDWYEELGFERSWEFTTTDSDTRNVYVTRRRGR
ncbi:VOC family protein [Halorubrum sp. GN11_10-6_MGM]|nr:VOC family protein [Halorubrum sp. GN11_10-6_MGM]